jgi:hypothetical protein
MHGKKLKGEIKNEKSTQEYGTLKIHNTHEKNDLRTILLQVKPISGFTQRDSIIIHQIISPFLQHSFDNIRTLPHGIEFFGP